MLRYRIVADIQTYREIMKRFETRSGATAGPSSAPATNQRRQIRRQGAFSGDINSISWTDLHDVRGYDPKSPRFYPYTPAEKEGVSTRSRKRSRDNEEDTEEDIAHTPLRRTFKSAQSDHESPLKRRKVFAAARVARMTTAPNHFAAAAAATAGAPPRSASAPSSFSTTFAGVCSGIISSVFSH